MRSFSGGAMVESNTASNRRQPVRQARTNPTRASTNTLQPRSTLAAPQHEEETPPGFCPAITHFTDSITALPKEMIRHYTMLKEVDAKIYGPEELLGQLVTTAIRAPIPPKQPASIHSSIPMTRTNTDITDVQAGTTSEGTAPSQPQAQSFSGSLDDLGDPTVPRRRVFANLRMVLGEMLPALDEKNHVMLTATDCLDKQLARCESSYPHITDEISEEARCGSKTHWAYRERTKATTVVERATRHLAASAAIQAADGPAARSEVRREALAARKQKSHYADSDFEDAGAHTTNKKANAGSKGRKVAELYAEGLGISSAGTLHGPASKRRKVEKTVGGLPVQRTMSSVYGSNPSTAKGLSPRDTPVVDGAKKRGRVAVMSNGTARKRGNTNTSAANSPAMASSPVVGSFPVKEIGRKSPAPSTNQRAQSSRQRQKSSTSLLQDEKPRPGSSSTRAMNGNGVHATTADVDKVSGLTGRSVGEVKDSMKETINSKGEHLVEDIGVTDGPADVRGGFVVGGRDSERSLKREDPEVDTGKGRADRPSSISITTRGNGKNSKTATPLSGSFGADTSRPTRAAQPPKFKRSHKKGAGIQAQMAVAAAAAAARDEEDTSEEDDDDRNERRYCYCSGISYGEMVGCEMGELCDKEWFHLPCVGLTKAPGKNVKWYCNECKEKLKRNSFANGTRR